MDAERRVARVLAPARPSDGSIAATQICCVPFGSTTPYSRLRVERDPVVVARRRPGRLAVLVLAVASSWFDDDAVGVDQLDRRAARRGDQPELRRARPRGRPCPARTRSTSPSGENIGKRFDLPAGGGRIAVGRPPRRRPVYGMVRERRAAGRVAVAGREHHALRRSGDQSGCVPLSAAERRGRPTFVPVARSTIHILPPHAATTLASSGEMVAKPWPPVFATVFTSGVGGGSCVTPVIHRLLPDVGVDRRHQVLAVARDDVARDALHLRRRPCRSCRRLADDVVLGIRVGDVAAADARPRSSTSRRWRPSTSCFENPIVMAAARRTVGGSWSCRARRRSSRGRAGVRAGDVVPRHLVDLPAAGRRVLARAEPVRAVGVDGDRRSSGP